MKIILKNISILVIYIPSGMVRLSTDYLRKSWPVSRAPMSSCMRGKLIINYRKSLHSGRARRHLINLQLISPLWLDAPRW